MKINRAFIKGTNWALAGLISMLGFAGCNTFEPRYEYGVPHADYTVKGVVVNEATGKPIEGIRVVVPRVDHHQRSTYGYIPDQSVISREVRDTAYTKVNGVFEFKYTGTQTNDSTNIIMKFEDINENPIYQTDSTKVTFFESDLKGGSGWFQGSASKEINIKLKNQERE